MGCNKEKSTQLGMSTGKAYGILLKKIIYSQACELDRIGCVHCFQRIEFKDFSIEHLIPWLHSNSPKDLYFEVKNVGFSHLKCNIASARCPAQVRSKTGYKGVDFHGGRNSPKKYRAIMCRRSGGVKRNITIGWFVTPEEAAKAYDEYALENLKERAVTNKQLRLVT